MAPQKYLCSLHTLCFSLDLDDLPEVDNLYIKYSSFVFVVVVFKQGRFRKLCSPAFLGTLFIFSSSELFSFILVNDISEFKDHVGHIMIIPCILIKSKAEIRW